jgi:F0F1-type ATP synthase membrane subunit b/b'
MKSKRAEEFINNRSELIDGLEWMVDASTARRAVELAEQDAEEEIEDKCKGFVEILETLQEEHEQQIEALKKRAVEAFGSLDFTEFMTAECVQDFDNVKCKLRGLFIQKINEQ